MKVIISYQLYYDNRSITKNIYVNNNDSIEHAKQKFDKWAKKKYKNAHTIKIIEAEKVEPEFNVNKNNFIDFFNNIVNTN